MNLIDAFQRYIEENRLLTRDDRILLTVSGGVDSMVMLSLFTRCGYTVGVAHCNFQLRGSESDEDEVLVAEEAARCGVPCYNKRFETAAEMERTGESMEMAARRLRYAWFDELSSEYGYTAVAVAHHADDSIETFFINLLRGTGLRGLTGISTQVGRIVRPLMFASRKEILEYAVQNHIPFREDSSNRSTKYLRNKIRLGLIPRIREINPKFTELMRKNLGRLTDAQLFINHGIERIRDEAVTSEEGIDTIYPDRIDPAFPRGSSSTNCSAPPTDSRATWSIRSAAPSTKGNRAEVLRPRPHGRHRPRTDRRLAHRPRRRLPDHRAAGRLRSYCGNAVLFYEYCPIDDIRTFGVPEHIAQVDADKLRFPLTLRRWHEGDWFIPYGMTGRKKVSDYLIDTKVSTPEKQRQFVLLSGDEIVWLVGRRIDDRYRLTRDTENVLRITKEIV